MNFLPRYRFLAFCLLQLIAISSHAESYLEAVKKLGYEEVAQTFSQDKASHITGTSAKELPLVELQAKAVLTLIGAPLDPSSLSLFIDEYQQKNEAYVGKIGEKSLIPKVISEWRMPANSRSHFAIELRQLMQNKLANGYNIATSVWPNFHTHHYLIYGHNDIRHAEQLILLLASEGVKANVGFSKKVSAFMHRDGWGAPPDTATELNNNSFLIEADEYDLHFEFYTKNDKQAFISAIQRYAKKQTGKNSALIYEAWWQPFIRSFTSVDEFIQVAQVNIIRGSETAQILLRQEEADMLSAKLGAVDKNWQIQVTPVWVNPAFYRYLEGSFQ